MSQRSLWSLLSFPLLCVVTLHAQTPAVRISGLLDEFNTTLEELAKSSVLRSNDAYFVNDLFLSIIRQNPAIDAVARISSDGTVLNRVTPQGTSGRLKTVANERWFVTIAQTPDRYNDLFVDQSGALILFRAWPLFADASGAAVFSGIFTVRINLNRLLAGFADAEGIPMEALYKEAPFIRTNWRVGELFDEETIALPGGDRITLRFQTPPAAADTPKMSPVSLDAPSDKTPDSLATSIVPQAARTLKPAAGTEKPKGNEARHAPAIISPVPSLHATVLSDAFLKGSDLPSPGGGRIVFIVILSILTLCAIIVSLVIVVRMMAHRHHINNVTRILTPGPIEAIVVPASTTSKLPPDTKDALPMADNDPLLDIVSAERETKELPALKELIADSSHRLKSLDSTIDAAQRQAVLAEIHENLSQWVRSELGRLTSQLGSLAQEIRECESTDGHAAELQVLRYEIERIVDEINGVDRKIPAALFHKNSAEKTGEARL